MDYFINTFYVILFEFAYFILRNKQLYVCALYHCINVKNNSQNLADFFKMTIIVATTTLLLASNLQ